MPGVVLAVIVALIVSSYLKRRKKKEQARLSPADERKLSARPEPGGPVLTDLELDVAASAPEGSTFVYAPPLDPALWRRDESRSDSEWRERSGDARWRVSTWVQR